MQQAEIDRLIQQIAGDNGTSDNLLNNEVIENTVDRQQGREAGAKKMLTISVEDVNALLERFVEHIEEDYVICNTIQGGCGYCDGFENIDEDEIKELIKEFLQHEGVNNE
jgi:hypothetical protein